MKILTYGNPLLRKKASKIKAIDKEILLLSKKMFEEMDRNIPKGVGLAAVQVGLGISLFIYKFDDDKGVVLNPEILSREGKEIGEEGCLSVPGVYGEVERNGGIVARWLDLKGKKHEEHLNGLKARVFQHEIDHLNGIIFTDHIYDVGKINVEEGFEIPEQLIERLKSL